MFGNTKKLQKEIRELNERVQKLDEVLVTVMRVISVSPETIAEERYKDMENLEYIQRLYFHDEKLRKEANTPR